MCSPVVMEKVAQEISRRNLLKGGGAIAAVSATGLAGLHRQARAQTTAEATPIGNGFVFPSFSTVFDLTHTWGPDFPVFYGATSPVFEVLATVDPNGFYKMWLQFDEHTGTHMDAPGHFVADGMTADLLPIEQFFAPLVVIDISAKAADDPDAQGTVEDLATWEAEYGAIPAGAFVALNSGWGAKTADPAAFINLDADNVQHFPGWHADAAAELVARGISGAGVDTASLDHGPSADFAAHLTFLPAGVFGIEGLANLDSVPAHGAHVIIGGPKHVAASGGPSRVFAVL